jgi:hypothetical protein
MWDGRMGAAMSPAPVAAVHAAWEGRCDACHEPFTGIQAADRCGTCHAGPAHFANQAVEANRCAACHVDHRGHDTVLARVADEQCTSCHRDLAPPNAVLGFPAGHPDKSRSVNAAAAAGRTLKFSHAVHLRPGLFEPDYPRKWRLKDIPDPAARNRYQALQDKKSADDLVTLDCRACHRLDGGDFGPLAADALAGLPAAPLQPHRAAGGNPLPITFENQCRGCHPLPAAADQQVPHRIQPPQLHALLEQRYAERLIRDRLPLKDLTLRPDNRLDRPSAVRTASDERTGLVETAEKWLGQSGTGCMKCHRFDKPDAAFKERTVLAARARDLWYEQARFTHVAHRAVGCGVCHGDPAAGGPNETEPPLVPDVATCKNCHATAAERDGQPVGGARTDCVECHRYHDINRTHQGVGAAARDPGGGDLRRRLDAASFLRGQPTGRDPLAP